MGMGGDYAPEPIVKGTLMALETNLTISKLPFLVMKLRKWHLFLKQHGSVSMSFIPRLIIYLNGEKEILFKLILQIKNTQCFSWPLQLCSKMEKQMQLFLLALHKHLVGGHLSFRKCQQMKRVAIVPLFQFHRW